MTPFMCCWRLLIQYTHWADFFSVHLSALLFIEPCVVRVSLTLRRSWWLVRVWHRQHRGPLDYSPLKEKVTAFDLLTQKRKMFFLFAIKIQKSQRHKVKSRLPLAKARWTPQPHLSSRSVCDHIGGLFHHTGKIVRRCLRRWCFSSAPLLKWPQHIMIGTFDMWQHMRIDTIDMWKCRQEIKIDTFDMWHHIRIYISDMRNCRKNSG